MPMQYYPFGKSEIHQGLDSFLHLPPESACQEALKPLPFMDLSVLNRIASSFPVLETCMGITDDLWAHSWVNRGEWKSGPPYI